ncbi:ABC transporter permease [Pelagibius sp.]|uniref:ABC transporter permease n=1 Tax=Pelagibius sp. TaxID=1931238 RepID=UPI0026188B60|nr:ABC transporter permease [Pelagibius sp.]
MDFTPVIDNFDLYLEGLWTTVRLVFFALVFGFVLAVPFAIMRTSKNPAVNGPVWAFTYFFRGTPLLVQMFLVYYGLGQMQFMIELSQQPAFEFLQDAYWYALFAFTLNTAAYTTEIFRGAILGTPYGEVEAARACGMSKVQIYRRVILPSAFRRALPAYSNEVIFMLHGSAIASVITIVDLLGAARIINSRYFTPYEAFISVGVLYFCITFALIGGFKLLENRWFAHLRPREETTAKRKTKVSQAA